MPNIEGQTYLKNAVKDLLDRFALEYVLAELRDQVKGKAVTIRFMGSESKDWACDDAANRLDDALRAYCVHLPGYRDELTKQFNPRW